MFPKTMAAIYDHFVAGDLQAARAAQDAIRGFRDAMKEGGKPEAPAEEPKKPEQLTQERTAGVADPLAKERDKV